MMHQFIESYFKDSLDSIKSLHQKIRNTSEKNNRISHTIYYDEGTFYAMIDNDYKTAKHLSCFNIEDIIVMELGPNVNKSLLEEFILSTF